MTDYLGEGREKTHSIRTGKLEAQLICVSHLKWPSSQDQQKSIRPCLIIFKVTLTSHFMLIFVLHKVTLPNHINTVPWMNEVTLIPFHECTQLFQKIIWFKWIKVTWRSLQTAFIHGKELLWPRSFMVGIWCDLVCCMLEQILSFLNLIFPCLPGVSEPGAGFSV